MSSIPAKAIERIKKSLKHFQPIVKSAKARDINESDTVVVITDMLESVFGYDKYTEITSEYAIRGTFCDLAVKLDGELAFLLEVKAIGIELKDQHIKQAVDYAANQGIEWVGLTNGAEWRIYKVTFGKPIGFETVLHFNILDISHKKNEDIEMLALLAKEGWKKAKIEEHHSLQQYLNRFTIGALLLTEPVAKVLRRELRRISTDIKITEDEISSMIETEVLKREIVEGEKADQAKKLITKAAKKALRKTKAKQKSSNILELEKEKKAKSEEDSLKVSNL